MWFEHLKTVQDNRKRGAAQAAETRRKKVGASSVRATPTTAPTVLQPLLHHQLNILLAFKQRVTATVVYAMSNTKSMLILR